MLAARRLPDGGFPAWVDVEEKGKPSQWVTLRALPVLKQAHVS